MRAVRIGMGFAIPTFAVSLGLCYVYAFYRAPGGESAMDMLPMVGAAGILAGAMVGFLIVPWFGYPHIVRSMTIGAISAVVSNLPFSLLFALVDALAGKTVWTADGVMRIFHYTLVQGAEIVFQPLIVFGAVAGMVSYLLSRRHASTNE